ncbi:MAG TPA: alpha/beta fold hydrolase, partial [Flavitalea sp.]|nr:alpha/beta fold hydrolase [Flavitalea sp.]
HADHNTRRVSLPTYPFEKISHWISDPKKNIKQPKGVSLQAIKQEKMTRHHGDLSVRDNTQLLRELFAEKLKMAVHLVDENTSFYDLGIESILLMEILQSVTKTFNLKVNLTEVQDFDTIKKWAEYIDANSKGTSDDNYREHLPSKNKMTIISSTDHAKYESLFLNKYEYAFKGYLDQMNITFLHSSTGQKIEAFMYGHGEPLLLLPPIDGISTCWLQQFKELGEQFRLIVLHYPGYGRSEFNSEDANFDTIADESMRALTLLGITENVHLAGWSMGGMIAQVIATKYFQRVKTLTLVNTTSFLDEEATIDNIYALATKVRDDFRKNMPKSMQKDNDQILESIKACYFNEVSLHYHLQVLDFDYRTRVSNINLPTLIISGRKDKLTPPENGAFIHQQIKNSEFHVFKDGGHYIPLQNFMDFNKVLSDFIEGNRTQETKSISEELEVH